MSHLLRLSLTRKDLAIAILLIVCSALLLVRVASVGPRAQPPQATVTPAAAATHVVVASGRPEVSRSAGAAAFVRLPPTRMAATLTIDDATIGQDINQFDYVGHWQHVHGKRDGRSNGSSSRSARLGDFAMLRFIGSRVRLYGVRGPSGGRGALAIDGPLSAGAVVVDFYAPRVVPNALVYESDVLPVGLHRLSIMVHDAGLHTRLHTRLPYVNVDGAEVTQGVAPP